MFFAERMKANDSLDSILRLSAVVIMALLIWNYSLVYQSPYPEKLVELEQHPWWRALLVIAIVLGALWCPRVGVLLALAAVLYMSDVGTMAVVH